MRQGFKESCSAKMIQQNAFSSPHSGMKNETPVKYLIEDVGCFHLSGFLKVLVIVA